LTWQFHAPLFAPEVGFNQPKRDADVTVWLENYRVRKTRNLSETGKVSSVNRLTTFDLYFGMKDEVGVNNYNEIQGHPIDESRWETIYEPLRACLETDYGDAFLNLCELLGINLTIPNEDWSLFRLRTAENLSGIKVSIQLLDDNTKQEVPYIFEYELDGMQVGDSPQTNFLEGRLNGVQYSSFPKPDNKGLVVVGTELFNPYTVGILGYNILNGTNGFEFTLTAGETVIIEAEIPK
jgi:hypothetical protein